MPITILHRDGRSDECFFDLPTRELAAGDLAGVRFVHRKTVACVFTDGRAFGWRLALQSAGLWALLWLAFTLPLPGAWAGVVRRIEEIPTVWWPAVFLATVAAMTVGRTAEEVISRGYLQTRIAA